MSEADIKSPVPGVPGDVKSPPDGEYQSQNKEVLDAARKANNVWTFEGRELEMFVARGEASVATNIVKPGSNDLTGASLVHNFKWDKPDAFVIRENSLTTNLTRVGRRLEQKINTSHLATVNSKFYQEIVAGGQIIRQSENNKTKTDVISKDDMISHARYYPEAASEAIETWLDAAIIERLGEDTGFDFLFSAPGDIQILWGLGSRDLLAAAGIFKFSAPTSERRAQYDASVQTVETKRTGEVSSTDIEENFRKKIQYGAEHLLGVEGIALLEEGRKYDKGEKESFITNFNPIWFGDIVDTMHSTFDFMKGGSGKS